MKDQTNFIIQTLRTYYRVETTSLALLPLGADPNASIYKVHGRDAAYFVKVRRGPFRDLGIMELLESAGIQQLMHPVKSVEGKQTIEAGDFTFIVYPFIDGQDGFSRPLSDEQWVSLGQALRRVHEINVPPVLQARIRREEYSPRWRNAVRELYAHYKPAGDEAALKLWKFLQEHRAVIERLVDRSEKLSSKVQGLPFVLCHSDIHGGNVLMDEKSLYIIDWDDPILAPKERDLMFIGGGVGNVWNKPRETELFYRGYGQVEVDAGLLAYYRHERIVEDIAVYAEELLLKTAGGENRLVMLKQFTDQFVPNGVVQIALSSIL